MLKNTFNLIGLCSLICIQGFSNENLLDQSRKTPTNLSFLNDEEASAIRAGISSITSGESEDTLNFEKYFDLLNPLMTFSQENKTKCLVLALSDLKSREFIASLAQNERTLQFVFTELNNKKELLSALLDADLFKHHLMQFASSLNLDETAVEYHIDQAEYGQLFYDLGIL